jgi:bacterioferritin (cytochrome b1)
MLQTLTNAALNELLAHEQHAAEACHDAIARCEHVSVVVVLRRVMNDHQMRAAAIHETIRELDGHPLVEPRDQRTPTEQHRTGDLHTVLERLLELEQQGVATYRRSLKRLDNLTRTKIEADLLPGQETSLATIAGAQPPSPDGAV